MNDSDEKYSDEDLKLNIHNLYKHRWVWYHTLLGVLLLNTNIILVGVLVAIINLQ